jgi:lipopolysaccharide transport system ATP-binding protein
MSDYAIKIENLSKQYRLGMVGTGTLSHDLKRWWTMNILGKEDPYLKIGETNTQASKSDSGYVWALRDINLEVKQGEILGIIGKNGAGKSTLLKLLSRVTKPTTGSITYKGRIASLLEVGTGFHPEMTGRENIYMNGTIMGMTRAEINRQLDAIIDFAGVARYIDTPVKRYSSGMTVRLGFAIAAHLEPEILVVDEVLAVGDAEFQKKAIGKMQDVSHEQGRTVLFVSHNMAAVRNLCKKGIVLSDGLKILEDEVNTAVDHYLAESKSDLLRKIVIEDKYRPSYCSKDVEILEIELSNELQIATDEPLRIRIRLKVNNLSKKEARITGMLNAQSGNRVGLFFSKHFLLPENYKPFDVFVTLKNHNLAKGYYYFDFNVGTGDPSIGLTDFDIVYKTISFEIIYDDTSKKDHIAKWASNWGYNNFKNIDLKIIQNESN